MTNAKRLACCNCQNCRHYNNKHEVCELWKYLEESLKECGEGRTLAQYLDDEYDLTITDAENCETGHWFFDEPGEDEYVDRWHEA